MKKHAKENSDAHSRKEGWMWGGVVLTGATALVLFFGSDALKARQAPKNHECDPVSYQEKLGCYGTFYEKIVKSKGAKAAMADVRARYEKEPFVRAECHQISHTIGRAAARIHKTAEAAFAVGDSFCWSGYYHGAMEGIIQIQGKPDFTTEELDNICVKVPGKEKYSFDYYNCVHGLGHGIMFLKNNELPESLQMCDKLTGPWEQSSCWSGAIMENVIADGIEHKSKYLKPDDPHYPCNFLDVRYKLTCYLMQTSYMNKINGLNYGQTFKWCGEADAPYVDTCYQSLGRDASGNTVSDPVRTKEICMLGNNFREQSNCIIGAVKDFISYHHDISQAKNFCGSLSPELKNICESTAESYYQAF